MSKKVGILGSGAVAKALAKGFKKYGYEVMIGSRDTQKQEAIQTALNIETGTFEQAAVFGDMVVLAVKGLAAKEAIELAGVPNLNHKTVLDTTNPIAAAPPVNGVLQVFTAANSSLMETLQASYPEVHFVKCFNSVGNGDMVNPDFAGEKPTMFICGNNAGAKAETSKILDQFGWETEDCGAANAAGSIESLCVLWCIRGMREGKWAHAFRLLKR